MIAIIPLLFLYFLYYYIKMILNKRLDQDKGKSIENAEIIINDSFIYKNQLAQLRNMGYKDDISNILLLSEYDGDIQKVISTLVNHK